MYLWWNSWPVILQGVCDEVLEELREVCRSYHYFRKRIMGDLGIRFTDRNLEIVERFFKSYSRIDRRGSCAVDLSYPGELKKPLDEAGDSLGPVHDLGNI